LLRAFRGRRRLPWGGRSWSRMRRFRPIVRLRSRCSICRWRGGGPIIRRRCGWPVRSCLRTIRRRRGSRAAGRWRCCWPISWRSWRWLSRRASRGLSICRRLISRTIGRGGRRRLPRSRHVRWGMTGGRRRRLSRRRYLHHRTRRCCGRWTQGLHFASRQRLPGMRRKSLLLFRKRYGRRRRRFLGNHLPACHCRWRRRHVACGRSLGAQNTLSGWNDGDSCTHRRRRDLSRADLNSRRRYWLCAYEGVLRHHHHRALHVPVRVGNVRGRVVNNGRVIDVGYLGDVDRRTADVDASHIRFAHVIGRHINFPRP
jgi:hypothetical protein